LIVQSICLSFKNELPLGLHDFTFGSGNTFKMALYTSAANLNENTLTYVTQDEVVGAGYVAGGVVLTSVTPTLLNGTVVFDFADAVWENATFTARGAMIYNQTSGQRSVLILDFGSDRTANNNTFTVTMPEASPSDAIIRIA